MFYSDVGHAKFEFVYGPIAELGFLFRSFFGDVEVCAEHESGIAGDEYEDMPSSMHVWEVDVEPCVAEHSVDDPTEHGQKADGYASQSQPVHARTFNPEIDEEFIKTK